MPFTELIEPSIDHYFDSIGGGDMTQIMPNPEEAFNLVLVSFGGRPWMGSHGYDRRPGQQRPENVCRILFACTFSWGEFP